MTAPKKTDRYRETVFLPKTDFPMKAGLPQKEPEILKRWADMDLYKRLREQSKGREKFVLHDGPPYANGNIHIGHALAHGRCGCCHWHRAGHHAARISRGPWIAHASACTDPYPPNALKSQVLSAAGQLSSESQSSAGTQFRGNGQFS